MNLEKRSAEVIRLDSEDDKFNYEGMIVNEPVEHNGKLLINGYILLDKQQAIELARRLTSWVTFGTLEEIEAKTEGEDIKVTTLSWE